MSRFDEVKKKAAADALKEFDWNISAAARYLGLTQRGLSQMARRYGLLRQKSQRALKWVKA